MEFHFDHVAPNWFLYWIFFKVFKLKSCASQKYMKRSMLENVP